MKKKIILLVLLACMLVSTCTPTECAVAAESVESVILEERYASIHIAKEEAIQKSKQGIAQFEADLNTYRKKAKSVRKSLDKKKKNFKKIEKTFQQAEQYFEQAEKDLAQVQEDLYAVSEAYRSIYEYFDPDMGYLQTEEDTQQANLDLEEIKEYLTQTREYLNHYTKFHQITSESFVGDLEKTRQYLEQSKKIKNAKTVKTKQKLDEESIRYSNKYDDYCNMVTYGIYDDKSIDAEVKAFHKFRKSKKLKKLKLNKKLSKAAAKIALEYAVGYNFDKNGDKAYGFGTHRRPDGSSYTTAIKECGVKFKTSSIACIDFVGEHSGFVNTMVDEFLSDYKVVLESKEFTEFGIGYYVTGNGNRQIWVLIPISK